MPELLKAKVSAPVFLPKPVLEYFGHTQDILDICWSKITFAFIIYGQNRQALASQTSPIYQNICSQ